MSGLRRVESEQEHPFAVESEIDGIQVDECADEKAGGRQKEE